MTIEQEFFKSFNIPTKFYTTVNLGDLDNNYQEVSANTLQELFDDNAFWIDTYIEDIKDFHDWEEKYPLVTPEIVLGLEEIIIEKFGDIYWDKKYVHKDGYKMYRCKCTLQNDEISAMWAIGKTKKDTLIDLCRYLKNDEIQEQVRVLFDAM